MIPKGAGAEEEMMRWGKERSGRVDDVDNVDTSDSDCDRPAAPLAPPAPPALPALPASAPSTSNPDPTELPRTADKCNRNTQMPAFDDI